MNILTISDTHTLQLNWMRDFPIPKDIDMVIHAGDITNVGRYYEYEDFLIWFDGLPAKHKIFIAGNHDFGLENSKRGDLLKLFDSFDVHYLEDSSVEIEGIKIWGSPVSPPFFNWAFMRDSVNIQKHWEMIPDDVDILVTHTPARGILDFAIYGNEHTGCPFLLEKIKDIKPKYHIFGHIHEGYGMEKHGETTFINASVLNERYEPANSGFIINI